MRHDEILASVRCVIVLVDDCFRRIQKEDLKKEVEQELTGRETEAWEIVYFKLYQSQMPVIEKAIETAALMLGSDRSRGYLPGNDLCGLSGRG